MSDLLCFTVGRYEFLYTRPTLKDMTAAGLLPQTLSAAFGDGSDPLDDIPPGIEEEDELWQAAKGAYGDTTDITPEVLALLARVVVAARDIKTDSTWFSPENDREIWQAIQRLSRESLQSFVTQELNRWQSPYIGLAHHWSASFLQFLSRDSRLTLSDFLNGNPEEVLLELWLKLKAQERVDEKEVHHG